MIVPVNASTVVDYSVSAFSIDNNGAFRSTSLGINQRTVYGSNTVSYAGGYRVTLPPNSQSGYLIVAGYMPLGSTNTATPANGSWGSPAGTIYILPAYSVVSSSPTAYFPNPSISGQGDSFNGIIYIPAHSVTLYLFVGSWFTQDVPSNVYRFGAASAPDASIHFIPDVPNGSSEVVGGLTEINQSIQNIINQITSSPEANADSEAMVEHMEQLQDRIDELTQQIEENTNRPPPEDLVPSIPPVMVSPSDPAAIDGRKAISDILSSSFLTTFLLMVFSLAFLRYVLFGKSK